MPSFPRYEQKILRLKNKGQDLPAHLYELVFQAVRSCVPLFCNYENSSFFINIHFTYCEKDDKMSHIGESVS